MNFKDFKSKYQKKDVYETSNKVVQNPILSVCVQTYNHGEYIGQCLDGILMQKTNFSYEILLSEDDSSDETRKICIEYAEKYPETIRLFLHDRKNNIKINGSATGRYCFLWNLKHSNGKYIALCEGDDYWTDPLKLQKQVDFLKAHPDVNICFTRANVLTNNTLKLHEIPKVFNNEPFKYIDLLKKHNFIVTASVMFKKPNPFVLPDWFLKVPFGDISIYKLVAQNKEIQCINEVTCVYRVHDNGIYSGLNLLKARQNYLNFFEIIFPHLDTEEKQVVKVKIKEKHKEIAKIKYSNSKWKMLCYYAYLRLNNLFKS
ncbi:glycosyltransferase family 2 protein [Lacinutrix gracilariae]|uniref:Glycosyltransferase family 2 protein n=1 Tax=Lacinutrix gracilariae TaxID=1747198 RepID=A0ABW5JZT0_9FLAO